MELFAVTPENRIALELILLAVFGLAAVLVAQAPAPVKAAQPAGLRVIPGRKVTLG